MHRFQDFKGFANAELNLFRPLTVLIGPNGSGKSNVIEGIELLSFLAHGGPLHEIVDLGRGGGSGLEIRGGLEACARHGGDVFSLSFGASTPFEGEKRNFWYKVSIGVKPHPRIVQESLVIEKGPMIFETVEGKKSATSGDVLVRFNNFARGGKKPQVSVSANRAVLSQYRESVTKHKKFKTCVAVIQRLLSYLRSSFAFDPYPNLMRDYQRIGSLQLHRHGGNISAVLFGLSTGSDAGRQTLLRLVGRIKQLPEEPYRELSFVETQLNDVIFGFKEGENGHFFDARLLSDGTLRTLAVLTALETVEKGSRLVIEEFDNGLHPSRVKVLIEALEDCCQRRELNVLVTTHNPATLDALSKDQLDGVVMCVWDKELKAFNLVRLADLPQYVEILESGRLGDLVTRRAIERYLEPNFEEKRTREALEWLDSLG
jgi:hypothetical protein